MKNLLFVKQHPCVQLGHLYEHLFVRRINEFFYAKQLYKTLDYSASGTTFDEGGVILVDVYLYSDEAKKYKNELENLSIEFGIENDNVTTAALRITAEEHTQLYIADTKKVLSELQTLDAMPWLNIDNVRYIDTRSTRRKNAPLYLTNHQQKKPRQLSITLECSRPLEALERALYTMLGRTLLFTISDKLAYHYGLYVKQISNDPKKMSPKTVLLVPSWRSNDIATNKAAQIAKEAASAFSSDATIKRFIDDLISTNYLERSHLAPDFERILKETQVLIGTKGWQEVATIRNIERLLNESTLRVRYGRQEQALPLRG